MNETTFGLETTGHGYCIYVAHYPKVTGIIVNLDSR